FLIWDTVPVHVVRGRIRSRSRDHALLAGLLVLVGCLQAPIDTSRECGRQRESQERAKHHAHLPPEQLKRSKAGTERLTWDVPLNYRVVSERRVRMAVAQPRADIVGEINTLLGKGSEFEGKLTFEGTVRVDGRIAGEIFSDDVLVVGEGAEVHAEIDIGEI